jgi:hypothetical protein
MHHTTSITDRLLLQHADRASFLWHHRERAARSATALLDDLVELDDALLANIEGLALALREGSTLDGLLAPQQDAGDCFVRAAAYCAADCLDPDADANSAFPDATFERAWIAAVALAATPAARSVVEMRWRDGTAAQRASAVRAAHAAGWQSTHMVRTALASEHSVLLVAALDVAGERRLSDTLPRVRMLLCADDLSVQRAAARALILLGHHTAARDVLVRTAFDASETNGDDLALLLQATPVVPANAVLKQLWHSGGAKRVLIPAVAAIGDPVWIDMCFDAVPDDGCVTEVHTAIGTILGDQCPMSDEAHAWWSAHRSHFNAGVRYRNGVPISEHSTRLALRSGRQAVRRAAAFELALRDAAQVVPDVTAPGWRQLALHLN